LTRASVGVPIGTHSRDELIKLEEKQNNATGMKKSYYNFMKRLTGKRSIKSYEVSAKNNTQNITEEQAKQPIPPMNFTNKTFDKIIKAKA
jgi:hypothetical protein